MISVSPRGDSTRLPFYLILACTVLLFGLCAVAGITNIIFPVKAAVAVVGVVAACAVVFRRPATLPLAALFFMVPFDNLLQTGQGTATKFLAVAATGSILVVLINRRRRISAPPVLAVWTAFLSWSIVALSWTMNLQASIAYLTTVLLLFAMYAVVSLLRLDKREVMLLCGAVVVGAAACATYGIWLFTHGTSIQANGIASQRLTISLGQGSFINADHFAGALVFPFALALVATLNLRGWRKPVMALVSLSLLGGIFVSATRGSVIAVGIVFLYLLIFYRHRVQLAVIAAIGLAASIPFPSVWMRFNDPSQGQAGGRFGIWATAWTAFRHHWLGGVGPGQFYLAYGEEYLKTAISGMKPWAQDPHNLIASTGVEVGIIGLALMLGGWYLQFRTVQAIPPTSPYFNLRVAMQAGTLGLFAVAMSVDIFFYKYLWIAFMLTVLVRNAWLGQEKADRSEASSVAVRRRIEEAGSYGSFEAARSGAASSPQEDDENRFASAVRI
jgi:O-antigen ligase